MFGERTRLGCWFESLAVASRPLQRRLRRNDLWPLNHKPAPRRPGHSEDVRKSRNLRRNGKEDCCGEAAATNTGAACAPQNCPLGSACVRRHVKFESRSTEKAYKIKTRCPLDSVPHAD